MRGGEEERRATLASSSIFSFPPYPAEEWEQVWCAAGAFHMTSVCIILLIRGFTRPPALQQVLNQPRMTDPPRQASKDTQRGM